MHHVSISTFGEHNLKRRRFDRNTSPPPSLNDDWGMAGDTGGQKIQKDFDSHLH